MRTDFCDSVIAPIYMVQSQNHKIRLQTNTILACCKSRSCSLQELLLPPAKAVFAKCHAIPVQDTD